MCGPSGMVARSRVDFESSACRARRSTLSISTSANRATLGRDRSSPITAYHYFGVSSAARLPGVAEAQLVIGEIAS